MSYFGDGMRAVADSNVDRPGLTAHPPEYIQSLLAHDTGIVPDSWEQEFGPSARDTNALLVFDVR